ncbi:TetR family transcriptional regulator C-terminal domain-containing protein [Curtobacterium sp. VKM Ac-2922]|uniref:TetR family transcriptional regulator C-terminal domain-containing protein n=1 Tax=Curtobacterium sp. VKM Ac-2922 TaxID=2929475 RepID=UPI001FB52D01|nr:TetR family transcriptional regulator C-terminal domain-containing protein [Curtobacterium sp. VKM Ac-2922]MCJ1714660.1 TetR family transcriptional regulator C-terminal domain-containing protein [Curtobacterium sp. VKM Ac-2922]
MDTLTDDTIVEEQTIAERLTRAAIRAYRMYAFTDVDAAVVAEVAGVPVDVVTRAFPSWDALLLVTYDYWTQLRGSTRRRKPTCAIEHVRMTLAEDIADPGLVRVLAGVINIAGAETSFAELFRKRYEDYATQLATALRRDFDAGVETSVIAPERAATQLLALYEGFQIQLLVRPGIDVLAEWDEAVRGLRAAWRRPRSVQAWDLDAVPTSPILPV